MADALEYCANELKLPEFQGCETTVEFIKMFDQLFDILNSRNPLAKGYKAPLRPTNNCTWDAFLTDVYDYILKLKNASGVQCARQSIRQCSLGFLLALEA